MTDTTASHATWERESTVSDNYTAIPHAMWTLDISYGAKCLLGWLHSHTREYLATLTANRIRTEFRCSGQVAGWIDELVDAGFVQVVGDKNRHRYRLLAKPWNALAYRPTVERPKNGHLDETPDYRPVTARKTGDNRPKNGHIEDYVEDHPEDQSFMPTLAVGDAPLEKPAVDNFDVFWGLFPRKIGKEKVRKIWGKLKPAEREAAIAAVEEHCRLWEFRQTDKEFIPHPTTWLNQRRWEDDLSGEFDVKPKTLGLSRAAQTIQEMMKDATARKPENRGLPVKSQLWLD